MADELEQYVPTIDAILSVSDLELITVKKIRFALQALFDCEFGSDKKQVNELIMTRYYKLVDDREKAATSTTKTEVGDDDLKASLEKLAKIDKELATRITNSISSPLRQVPLAKSRWKKEPQVTKKKKSNRGAPNNSFSKPLKLSPKLLALLDVDETVKLPRFEVVKSVWAHIKSNNLQNPNDKRDIICDEKMQPVFGKKTGIFSMNKVLAEHLFKDDDIENE